MVLAYSSINSEHTTVPHGQIATNETDIILEGNDITSLINNEFYEYNQLARLNLDNNRIHTISDTAFDNTVLESIQLKYNDLTVFPTLASVAGTLTYLDLTRNNIPSIAAVLLSPLVHMEMLILSYNPLSTWPDFTGVGIQVASTELVVDGIKTLPIEVTSTICGLQIVSWTWGIPEAPIINCPNDTTNKLWRLGLQFRELKHDSDFSRLTSLGDSGILTTLQMGGNSFESFPDLPTSIRESLTLLALSLSPLKTISSDLLEGYQLNQLLLKNTKLSRLPCEVFNIAMTIFVSDTQTLSMDTQLWQRCLCDRNSSRVQNLYLQNTMGTLSRFPDISDSLCSSSSVLTIILERVSYI